jgi:hypothetical protein
MFVAVPRAVSAEQDPIAIIAEELKLPASGVGAVVKLLA